MHDCVTGRDEASSGVECAIQPDRHSPYSGAGACTQCMPGGSIPPGDVVGCDSAGHRKATSGIERAIWRYGQRPDGAVVAHPAAQRMPLGAVPAGDVVGCDAAGCGEVAASVERAVRANRQGVDTRVISSHSNTQGIPLGAVPASNAVGYHATGHRENAPGIE